MNEIVKRLLLAGDIFMPEIHLRQPVVHNKPGVTCSTCGPFTKNKKRKKLKKNLKKKKKKLKKKEIHDTFIKTN